MPNLVGGAEPSKIMVGGTPVKNVYVGGKYCWPSNPTAKVQWVGSVVSSGTSNTFPAHQPGDLLVVWAQSATTTSPTHPADGGWSMAAYGSGGLYGKLMWKVATSSTTQFGTWNNVAWSTAYVFRNASTTAPFGGAIIMNTTGATSPEITLTDTSGDSLICYGFHNNGTSGAWGEVPGGFLGKNSVARMANLQKIDSTSDGSLAWSSTAGNVVYKGCVFEVLPEVADDAMTAADAPVIKGNADSGLYHLPGDPHYDNTVAEAWFTTEAEAQAAGFVRDAE
jgi:hypothetical protein